MSACNVQFASVDSVFLLKSAAGAAVAANFRRQSESLFESQAHLMPSFLLSLSGRSLFHGNRSSGKTLIGGFFHRAYVKMVSLINLYCSDLDET